MKSTALTFLTSASKYFTLSLLLISLNLVACKSALEEDLTPVTVVPVEPVKEPENTTAPLVDPLLNKTLRGSFSFPIGAAVDMDRLKGSVYSGVVSKEFSSVTAESSMKMGALHPEIDKYDFRKGDAIVAFAQKNNMRVHGHTLLWAKDSTNPKWVAAFQGDAAAWDQLLKSHIQTVVKHFKGQVNSWDVVNEPYEDNGTLKDNIWLRKLGPEYLTKAFIYAHEADPNALLFLNDYGQELGGRKMETILKFIADAKQSNVPLNGIGFQMHTVVRMSVAGLKSNLNKIAATGMLIHFSELDISVRYQKADTFPLDEALSQSQESKYKEIIQAYLSIPKKLQFGITTWGVSDGDTYFNSSYPNKDHDYPLLFDQNYKAKPAYKGFIEAGLGI